MPIALLVRERNWIVDRCRNAPLFERRLHLVAIGNLDRVLRPCRLRARNDAGNADLVGLAQALIVADRDPFAFFDLGWEYPEFLEQDRRLDGVQSRVHTDPHIFVFVAALAVEANGAPPSP